MGSENLYWVWLAERLGAGSRYSVELVNAFGSPFELYNATEEELSLANCADENLVHRLADKNLSGAYSIIDYCTANNVGILSYSDKNYPSRLKMLKDPPCVLYYKGTVPDFDNRVCIAVVGTRKMSEYGKRAAFKMGYELGSAEAIVVSGMALGIDSVAASGAICGGGKTVAVLGSGIDVVYPSQHKKLMGIIEENGAVITEFAPGTRPIGSNFPIRNRIISGLCQGTLIVEADESSGAMITARCALMQGRDIYALPGNVDESNAMGTNRLIRDGANVVLEAKDILENYNLIYGKNINYLSLTYSKERYVYDESVFDRMGIAARSYNGINAAAPKKELDASELKPARRTKLNKDVDRPTTETGDKKTVKENFVIEKKDNVEEVIARLGETERELFAEIPLDRAISMDSLCSLGYTVGDVMSALTVLEVNGLVTSLPGGLYIRK